MNTFSVLSTTLTTNYTIQINHTRRIRSHYEDQLTSPAMAALDRLINRLQEIDIARQYFKTIYLQEELSSLSRILLYAGLPTEAIAIAVLIILMNTTTIQDLIPHLGMLSAGITIGITPLALLCSYIIRITMVTQRTATTIPFMIPGQEK